MSRTLLAAVAASVVASIATTLLMHAFTSRPAAVPRDEHRIRGELPEQSPDAQPVLGEEHDVPAEPGADAATIRDLARQIEELRAQLRRTQRVEATPDARAILERLAATEGVQQLLLHKGVSELLEIGPTAVPDILDWLRNKEDRSYGSGLSHGNGVFRSYPRLRTVLMDALRQIGGQRAKQGLLDHVASSREFVDLRDLMVMYAATRDPMMLEGISGLIPGALQRLATEDPLRIEKDAAGLLSRMSTWIRSNELKNTIDFLIPLLSASKQGSETAQFFIRPFFRVLVEFTPERAANLALDMNKSRGSLSRLLWPLRTGGTRLGPVTRFLETLLRNGNFDKDTRHYLYLTSLPNGLSVRPESVQERIGEGERYVQFLEQLLATETDENCRQTLQKKIKGIRVQLEKAKS